MFSALPDAPAVVERYIALRDLDRAAPAFAIAIRDHFAALSPSEFKQFAANQIYIALGYALVAAASARVGCCPLGNFDAARVGAVLSACAPPPIGKLPGSTQAPEQVLPVIMLALGQPLTPLALHQPEPQCSQERTAKAVEDPEKDTNPNPNPNPDPNLGSSAHQLPSFRLPLDELCKYYGC